MSERFFAALKGHGATARYVLLPHEGHSYRARESLEHTLWEITIWLNRHVRDSSGSKPGERRPEAQRGGLSNQRQLDDPAWWRCGARIGASMRVCDQTSFVTRVGFAALNRLND